MNSLTFTGTFSSKILICFYAATLHISICTHKKLGNFTSAKLLHRHIFSIPLNLFTDRLLHISQEFVVHLELQNMYLPASLSTFIEIMKHIYVQIFINS